MNYKLLVLDIDGTVVNSKKEVTPRTKAAINKLQEMGVYVAIASGRPTPGVAPIANILDFHKYGGLCLSYNGARITNWKTKELIYEKNLPLSLPKRLYDDAIDNCIGIITYSPDEKTLYAGNGIDEFVKIESKLSFTEIKNIGDRFLTEIDFPVCKVLFTGEGEILEKVEPLIAEKYQLEANVFRSEPYFLEVLPKGLDKAYSIDKMLPLLNIKREEVICCGDGYNDLSMIKYAGVGVAMENAREPIKAVADYITSSNDNDGIVQVIEKFWNIKI